MSSATPTSTARANSQNASDVKRQTKGFTDVPEAVWSFHIGGYQVCQEWLEDGKGRILSDEDIVRYHQIVVALSETIRPMQEIAAAVERLAQAAQSTRLLALRSIVPRRTAL